MVLCRVAQEASVQHCECIDRKKTRFSQIYRATIDTYALSVYGLV